MLYNGERIGDGSPPQVDIAVDPLEGTTLCAKGQPNALAVIALSERGTMFDPGPCVYMEKMAGADRHRRSARRSTSRSRDVLGRIAERRGVHDRRPDWSWCSTAPRHNEMHRARPRGRRPHPPDHRRRRRGRRCIGRAARHGRRPPVGHRRHARRASSPPPRSSAPAGEMLGRLWPRDDDERNARDRCRLSTSTECSTTDDLVGGDDCFFAATGVTDGDLLKGVRFTAQRGAPRSRSSCARGRAPCASSTRMHDRAKLRTVGGYN